MLVHHYASHVTCHTSHVTRHTSHVTRHTSHVTCHTSHVKRWVWGFGFGFMDMGFILMNTSNHYYSVIVFGARSLWVWGFIFRVRCQTIYLFVNIFRWNWCFNTFCIRITVLFFHVSARALLRVTRHTSQLRFYIGLWVLGFGICFIFEHLYLLLWLEGFGDWFWGFGVNSMYLRICIIIYIVLGSGIWGLGILGWGFRVYHI